MKNYYLCRMIIKLTPEQTKRCLERLHHFLDTNGPWEDVGYLDLAGIRSVGIRCNQPDEGPILRRQLDWSMRSYITHVDSTIFLWQDGDLSLFHQRVLGLDLPLEDNYLMLVTWDGQRMSSFGGFSAQDGFFSIWAGEKQYYCVHSLKPEELLKIHLFAMNFSRMIDTPSSTMIHGACVGVDGKGVLLCARGGKGKSTLTVSSLFKGFEYVSDDYLIIRKEEERLLASPIYSMTALSPQIYSLLYNDLGPSRFIGLNGRMNKYILDISAFRDNARWDYPVKACVFPEIADVKEPQIIPCSSQEKGRALTHIVHSTIEQMQEQGNSTAVRKLLGMLSGLDFYRIVLSPDLFRNVECLRSFIKEL